VPTTFRGRFRDCGVNRFQAHDDHPPDIIVEMGRAGRR
jgi:hypothetical protein